MSSVHSILRLGCAAAILWLACAGPARAEDPARGHEAAARYGCVHCHALPNERSHPRAGCVSCHVRTIESRGPAASRISHYVATPGLRFVARRLSASYLIEYLMRPHDVRPHLEETMPRLPIDEGRARDLTAYLASLSPPAQIEAGPAPSAARVARGEALFVSKGCVACHTFGNRGFGDRPSGGELPEAARRALGAAAALAPNLRYARVRMERDVMLAWIRDPSRVDPETRMPRPELTAEEALAVRDFLWLGDPGQPAPLRPPTRAAMLEPVEREVSYAEVAAIFARSCVHCHAHSGASVGELSGRLSAFGFPRAELDLSSYEGVMRGVTRANGERVSLLDPEAEGEAPPLIARLLERHAEAQRDVVPPHRDPLGPAFGVSTDGPMVGMPLGLPPLPAEDLRLLVTWIGRGAPREL